MAHKHEKEDYSVEKILVKEIIYILVRNWNEDFLRKLLTRAIILEKLTK